MHMLTLGLQKGPGAAQANMPKMSPHQVAQRDVPNQLQRYKQLNRPKHYFIAPSGFVTGIGQQSSTLALYV